MQMKVKFNARLARLARPACLARLASRVPSHSRTNVGARSLNDFSVSAFIYMRVCEPRDGRKMLNRQSEPSFWSCRLL